MPRGFVRSIYIDDDLNRWQLLVDADSVLDGNRGWVAVDADYLPPLPRGWMPRVVVGVDETGVTRTARIALLEAPLWTGEVDTFVFEGSDGMTHTATVIRTLGERRNNG